MSTPRDQYHEELEDWSDDEKMEIFSHYEFWELLKREDPRRYERGMSDFKPTCDECGRGYWDDDPDDEAICPDCREDAESASEDDAEVADMPEED